jgi:hypothetical protein
VIVYAEVAKLVDALDLGSSVLRRESSSLSFRTKFLHGLLPHGGAFKCFKLGDEDACLGRNDIGFRA